MEHTSNQYVIFASIGVYFAITACIGVYGFLKTKTFSDYILGGRKIGAFTSALNVATSDMSAWILMGLPGAFYTYGASQFWVVLGLISGSYLSWTVIARRLRHYTEITDNTLTISSFLERRFCDKTSILRLSTSLITMIFFVHYIASGLVASATLFSELFAIQYKVSLTVSVIATAIYTLFGGFLATSWASIFQGILMLAALVISPFFVIKKLNGVDNIMAIIINETPTYFDITHGMSIINILCLFCFGLGYFGQPHIINKYMAMRSIKNVSQARNICTTWMILSITGASMVGIGGYAFFLQEPLQNPETVFIALAYKIFPQIMIALLVIAIIAAIMSTINSQLIICCSTFSEDWYRKFVKRDANNREMIWITRLCVVIITTMALLVASDNNQTVIGLVAHAWSGLGSSIGPVVIAALFCKRVTARGAIAGVACGIISTMIFSRMHITSYILPSFIISLTFIKIISFLDRNNIEPQAVAQFSIMSDRIKSATKH